MIHNNKRSVGILLISTWKYNKFIDPIVADIKKHLLLDSNIKIYLHSDSTDTHDVDEIITIQHRPWPLIVMNRYHLFIDHANKYNTEFLIYLDIDSKIINNISENILSNLFVTEHSIWHGTKGVPERNPKSTAFIDPSENNIYVASGFLGGRTNTFLDMSLELKNNMQKDIDNRITAIWHDESHLNRYVLDNKNKVNILPYHYMYIPGAKDNNLEHYKIVAYTNENKGFNKFENMIHR